MKKRLYIETMKVKKVEGFLYIKIEDESEKYAGIIEGFSPKKRLKVGTFKITNKGKRMGQKFIQIICDHALLNGIDEVYVTVFENDGDEEKQKLINLLKDFKFIYHSRKIDTNESVYVKKFEVKSEFNAYELYPLVDKSKDVYIIPIASEYHTELLPECYLNSEDKNLFRKNEIIKNSLEKTYIGNNLYKCSPAQNDILLFLRLKPKDDPAPAAYRTVLTGLGIIIEPKKSVSSYDINELCKSSVISKEEIEKKYSNGDVLNFLFVDQFSKRPILSDLRNLNICEWNEGIRGLTKIDKEAFYELIKIAEYKLNKRT